MKSYEIPKRASNIIMYKRTATGVEVWSKKEGEAPVKIKDLEDTDPFYTLAEYMRLPE